MIWVHQPLDYASYPPVDVLDLLVQFPPLEKGLGGFEEAEDEDVPAVVSDAQQWMSASGALVRCHVAQRGGDVFHPVQPESFHERDGGRGEEVETPLARCHDECVTVVHVNAVRDPPVQMHLG